MFSQVIESFVGKDKKPIITAAGKIEWLRAQIIGQCLEFWTPFGKRLLTYADHTASARSLFFIENFILQRVLPVYGNTHTEDSFVGRMTNHVVEEAQKYVKECMGGTDQDAILFCGSGSTAAMKRLQEVMAVAVPSTLREHILSKLKKRERWVVFVGPYEHHSNLLTWRQSLVEVVEIPFSKEGVVDMGRLRAELQIHKGRPKLGCFSACSNVTGILTDTRSISRLLHAHGAFACFDFAACAPYVKIDMRSGKDDGYDAVFISPHKFMGGPGTPGILMMSKMLYLLSDSPPSTCGGGTVDFVNFDEQNTLYYDAIEQREDAGTPAIIQKVRTALVYSVKEFLTSELIHSRELFFAKKAMSRLGKHANIQIYGPTLTVERIAIISFGVYPALDFPVSVDADLKCEDGELYVPVTLLEFAPRSGNQNESRPDLFHLNGRTSFQARSSNFPCPPHQRSLARSSQDTRPRGCNRLVSYCESAIKHHFIRSRPPSPVKCPEIQNSKEETAVKVGTVKVGTVRRKPLHGRLIVKLLDDLFGIQARGGCSCAAPYGHHLLGVDMAQSSALRAGIKKGYASVKPGWARLSFGYYLSNEEFDFILSAVEFIADFGARFLYLYDLNWKTGDWTFKEQTQHIRDIIAGDKQRISGDKNHLDAGLSSSNSFSFDVPSLPTEDYNKRLASYLQRARYFADCLPAQQPTGRELPRDLDPALITFRI